MITLSHLQNFLPLTGAEQNANTAASQVNMSAAQTPVKTYVSTAQAALTTASPQVVSVGLPQQFLQVRVVSSGGGNWN